MTSNQWKAVLALSGLIMLWPASSIAQNSDDERLRKDLQTVITLQGKPCGTVTKATKLGEDDYEVTCDSGDRYRVRVGANDRVVIEKL